YLAAKGAAVGYEAFQEAQNAQARREQEARQREEFNREMERWQQAQTDRANLERINQDALEKDADKLDRSRRERTRREDIERGRGRPRRPPNRFIPDPGITYVAMLDALEPFDDDSGYAATFDGLWLPPITNPFI